MDKVLTKIPFFAGKKDEWLTWRRLFKAVLYGKKLKPFLKTTKPGESASQAHIDAWQEKSEALFHELILNTRGYPQQMVHQFYRSDYCRGKDAWDALVNKYEGTGDIAAYDLSMQLDALRMHESEDPDKFFNKLESLHDRLKALGAEHGYTEPELKTVCFMRLPSTYGILRTCLQTAPAPEKKVEHPYEDFKERVRSFWITNILTSGEGGR